MNIKNRSGFTFIEIMATITILSFGIVFIYKALLISLDHQNYLDYRSYGMNLMDHKIEFAQFKLQAIGSIPSSESLVVHTAVLNNRRIPFKLTTTSERLEGLSDIFKIDMRLSWKIRGKDYSYLRSAYISRF